MGKYMRKSKTKGEIALMDVTTNHQSNNLGVRTRAKTLALKKAATTTTAGSGSYIQLRSRRLEKSPPPAVVTAAESRRQRQVGKERCLQDESPNSESVELGKAVGGVKEEEILPECKGDGADCGIEASYGENMVEFEGRERSTRETTPCSLIRDPETIRTPGSSTRPTTSTDGNFRVITNSMHRHIPTASEVDEFFTGAEKQQQQLFIEKYNFDPVNDKPLPGRYEWVEVDKKDGCP